MTEQLYAGDAIRNPLGMPTPEAQARWRRCKTLSPVQRGDTERLIADFMATRSITLCPARYAAPVEQRCGKHNPLTKQS